MKPMLFSSDMVRAILAGRKTCTRRIIKPQPRGQLCYAMAGSFAGKWVYPPGNVKICWGEDYPILHDLTDEEKLQKWTPPAHTDDILYVRETWAEMPCGFVYRADDEAPEGCDCDDRWHPSIHMPKEAARIFLRVENVRAERLQKEFFEPISPILEVQAEGIDIGDHCRHCIDNYGEPCCVDTIDEDGSSLHVGECVWLDDPRDDFARLWDSTIKPADLALYGWAADPWVWVIEFERCEKPELLPDWKGVLREENGGGKT